MIHSGYTHEKRTYLSTSLFSVYLSVCLSICLSVFGQKAPFHTQAKRLPLRQNIARGQPLEMLFFFVCLSFYLSVYLSVVSLSVCLSVCLSACLSIYLSVYLWQNGKISYTGQMAIRAPERPFGMKGRHFAKDRQIDR